MRKEDFFSESAAVSVLRKTKPFWDDARFMRTEIWFRRAIVVCVVYASDHQTDTGLEVSVRKGCGERHCFFDPAKSCGGNFFFLFRHGGCSSSKCNAAFVL